MHVSILPTLQCKLNEPERTNGMSLSYLEHGGVGKRSLELQVDRKVVRLSPKRPHCTSFKTATFGFRAMRSWGRLKLIMNVQN